MRTEDVKVATSRETRIAIQGLPGKAEISGCSDGSVQDV